MPKKDKLRNPVARDAMEFCKPKTYRNRKKHPTPKDEYGKEHKNKMEPYVRERLNYLLEDEL